MKSILLALLLIGSASANPLLETRYCGPDIKRDADGSISRSQAVLAAFKRIHPCPSTGLRYGPCENWEMQHLIPLKCGGCDSVGNLTWLPSVLKSGPGYLPVDRWERKVYCSPQVLVKMPKRQRIHLETHE